ncbi:MAG: 3-hydroxyacyl-CoA dehydrogenase family protein [Actinomycetota bacterium]|nr:3-hydroxyacyl-CoA dehydrogenase family protein [Acidimicrobiales bacterium]MEC7873799.1 3-hydroxyacyl-CoA dehydrogenase family protein [Actinomycetota bacterium]
MSRSIESVAVIGAGTMGSGIAAASAAAGCSVLLLDVSKEAAEAALEHVDENAKHLVTTGTVDADLNAVSDYDWVCEAVVEDLEIKRELFARLEPIRKDGSVISSNTSGIPLSQISAGMSPRFRADVAITHFFNPVKVMRLFELVPGEDTDDDVIAAFAEFGADRLGKGVVHAKDTVNFIGNRIGCFFMLSGLHLAKPFLLEGMNQETVDAILAAPVGLPPTGLYGLIDLIGLDVMELVGENLAVNLPEEDAGRAYTGFPLVEQNMHDRGQLGRKAGGGFFRQLKLDDGSRRKETFDLLDETWRDAEEAILEGVSKELGEVIFQDSPAGKLAWQIFGGTLRYAADLVPEIADDVVNIDNAIRWGFNWVHGPFEMLDHLNPRRVIERIRAEGDQPPAMLEVLEKEGASSFYRNQGTEFLGFDGQYHSVENLAG